MGNKQHLRQAFFPGRGGSPGMRGLAICVFHKTTEAWNMKISILRTLTKKLWRSDGGQRPDTNSEQAIT